MTTWKFLRTAYLFLLLLLVAAAFFVGLPVYRYLRQPVTAPDAASVSSGPAGQNGEAPRALDPRSLLGVNAATLPKFEGMVQRIAPDSPEAWTGLGILYQFKSMLEDAQRCYRKALELNPEHPDAHYRLGTAYHAANRLTDAAVEYRAAMRAKSGYLYAYYSLASVYQTQGKLDDAVWLYHEILRMDPKQYQARNNLGIIYEEKGRYEEALTEYEKAAALNPHDPVVKSNVEMARRELGSVVRTPVSARAAPAPAPEPPKPAPAPAKVKKNRFKPETLSTVYLKNKQVMNGQIVSRDAKGLWLRVDEGTDVYISNAEVERVAE